MGIIEYPSGEILTGVARSKLLARIASALQGRVAQAFVFGSIARDDAHHLSDIDLILVTETKRPFVNRSEDFFDLLDINPRIEMLIYTPIEFAKFAASPTVGFWQEVLREKIPLLLQ